MAVQPARHAQQVTPAPRRFTVEEYYRLAEAGILRPEERLELIDGEIIQMTPIVPGHAATVDRIGDRLKLMLAGAAIVRSQNPVRLGPGAEPEPDLAVVSRRDDYYASAHPVPADVMLIVEVADTSLEYDREVKGPLYARAGIPEYWIVDLAAEQVLVHRDPTPDGYRSVETVGRDGVLSPLAFPDLTLAFADVVG